MIPSFMTVIRIRTSGNRMCHKIQHRNCESG